MSVNICEHIIEHSSRPLNPKTLQTLHLISDPNVSNVFSWYYPFSHNHGSGKSPLNCPKWENTNIGGTNIPHIPWVWEEVKRLINPKVGKYTRTMNPMAFQEYVDQFPQKTIQTWPGWWLNQPIFKICLSNLIISPKFGVKIKDIWNHHPVAFSGWFHLPSCQVLRVERFSEFSGLSTMRLGRMDRDVRRIPGEKIKISRETPQKMVDVWIKWL